MAYNDSFKKYMSQWCPGCKVNITDFSFTDIGTKLPTKVVSTLQRNPKATYLVFGFGDAMAGVVPALKSAGLYDRVEIGGAIPSLENYQALKAGTQAFWADDNSTSIAWRETDMMVRALGHESVAVANDSPPPAVLHTRDNIGSGVFDSQGFWAAPKDYQAAFEKMWGLS